jgi:hypothetical protein
MKPTFKSTGGTSFFGTELVASVNELKHILGEPYYNGNDGEDKINFEWEMETNKGDVFTVYDWKEYRSIGLDEAIVWHIGGKSKTITDNALLEIMQCKYKIEI